jgi:23S rRNA (adenine1618-N6)-methyltransferase
MLPPKREHPKEKSRLHQRNRHRERYDFKILIDSCPELAEFVVVNAYDDDSIDFFNPQAVRMLNKALLKYYYTIENWNIPENYLCPPIPGRADYIHYLADLLSSKNNGIIPSGIKCLDIGVGANCVYPLIGNAEYGWSFVGAEIDQIAIDSANKIIELNAHLKDNIEIRKQTDSRHIFQHIIQSNERFDLTICNPPFHASAEEARAGSARKVRNLTKQKVIKPVLNFGGQNTELWCEGGEEKFIRTMISESKQFAYCCFWFTSLVAKESNLNSIYSAFRKTGVSEMKTIPMGQGNKSGRMVAWTFLSPYEQTDWKNNRWK